MPHSTQELADAVATALREQLANLTVPEDMHREHHEFIRTYIEERRIKQERAEKIKTQVLGWGIVALLSGIGTAFYNALQHVREHWK